MQNLPSNVAALMERVDSRDWTVGVVGLGYVGLPLAVEYARAGFRVRGVDLNRSKLEKLASGESYILDVSDSDLREALDAGLEFSDDYASLEGCDSLHIVVPTPLRKSKDPDISYIVRATESLIPAIVSRKGVLIVLESTTYPGSTRELIVHVLERRGLRIGEDFHAAFSPERVDPGNATYNTKNTPKVIGGVTPGCTELARHLYSQVIETVIAVGSPEEAEMVKLLENTFRAVNIGLVNEMTLMADRMGINFWNVIDAAKTKPFGFMAFYPGPGLGGHCIPLDPMYLSWKAKMFDFYNRFIELATDINGNMPRFVIQKLTRILNTEAKSVKGSRILLLGVSYKADIDDTRESPAIEIIRMLRDLEAEVAFSDPHVESLGVDGLEQDSFQLNPEGVESFDCVVLLTAHSAFDYEMIESSARLILDCRNGFGNSEKVVKL
ncbi:MAG: UDP-N-acetyl-D-glucosamine dehydrogenase [Candidatus Wallbacteria bacterium HGW-Wallbacteria-1]|uniref:UDP-N-acetyl-D-glucosamine dehydrogenase n=1 Tax=Candidatus Wallbacteria bacterium HGW-Wallbacteria-1 TaxID=2013854 RepID=A0A2N1PK64_9BACT|nr:MAG: UDP-N-acetyl-D-glucosamine dehydrogenase [Candidatus Wallbacteria bacterium HGW-Wallbacteria-1]